MNRLLLIGWDAADWKVIQPLLDAGQMPNLAQLMLGGVHGNLATIYPSLSPMLWTSIATGKRPYKHGIHGFTEPLPDGSGVRPITILSRKTKAIWNILNQTGHRSLVVGWWPSHPAEPLNGVMVSNHFQQPAGTPGNMPPLSQGIVHPPSLAESLSELRVNPMELNGDFIRFFVPNYQKVDQASDKRLHTLGKIIAETMSIHAVATELLTNQPWDFAAVYYSGIDHFGHAFMRYHPPQLPGVPEQDFAIYQDVVANGYRYHDAMLGTLLEFADQNTTVILMSDHGFHPDHLRPGYIPAEAAGPAVEHRHFGIVCLKGPQLRINEHLFGAGLLDICPTILTLFGVPPGADMDGKVLVTAFKQPPEIRTIESWDLVPGNDGCHPPETKLDPISSAEAFKQLIELGYVAPPGANAQEAVEESVRELKYNLARAYRDGNCCGEAAALAEELWNRWPKEHRFGILLIDCLNALRQVPRRRSVIEELARRIELYQSEAKLALAKIHKDRTSRPDQSVNNSPDIIEFGQNSPPDKLDAPPSPEKLRAQFEERHLRELAYGRPMLIEWFLVSQALLEKRPDEARLCLQKLADAGESSDALNQRIAGALAELGDLETATALLNESLLADPENPVVHSQLAAIHFRAGRFAQAIASATESLSLLYFQPGIHALLGHALIQTRRFAEAEQELRVAVSQSPRNLIGHELLARLYREHLDRPADAFAHEGRALSLRNELAARSRSPEPGRGELLRELTTPRPEHPIQEKLLSACQKDKLTPVLPLPSGEGRGEGALSVPAPFGPEVDPSQIITVVSGLPRSGTSMMMQLLAGAGRQVLTDSKRAPDHDNPLGYFEFENTTQLATDSSWMPQARGKVVKIVAQLLPFLPSTEHYQIVFMERNLTEVVSSQKAMLARQGRHGAELKDDQLMTVYSQQLQKVRNQLVRRREIRTLTVSYADLLAQPGPGLARLAQFLGKPFDTNAAAQTIRPELRRQTQATG